MAPVEVIRSAVVDAHAPPEGGVPHAEFESRLPPELIYGNIMPRLGTDELQKTPIVSKVWKEEADKLIGKRREEIEPFANELNTLTGQNDPQRALAVRTNLSAINEDLDNLSKQERTQLASFLIGLPDSEFVQTLPEIGPGIRHFSVKLQNDFLDKGEEILRRADDELANALSVQRAMMRFVPDLSGQPRQRAFNTFFLQAPVGMRKGPLASIAEMSHRMRESELDAAVDAVTNPSHYQGLPNVLQRDQIVALGRGRGLHDRHRNSLLESTQAFDDSSFSKAAASILDGASSTAHWPSPQRLETLAERADNMQMLKTRRY